VAANTELVRFATPFDLLDLFPPEGRVAVIGNAPSVLENNYGAYIDSHDVIVRFNECAVEGYESKVGSRTDILITNVYPEKRTRKPGDGRPIKLVLAIASQIRRGSMQSFTSWIGDYLTLFTYSPDLIGVPDSAHRAGLTTGTYGIQLIWRLLRPSKIFLTGFTMFSDSAQSHYWAEGDMASRGSHDFEAEPLIFCKLLNSIRPKLEVTGEILHVFKKVGMRPSPYISTMCLDENP